MKIHNLFIPAKWAGIGTMALLGACQNQEKEPQQPNIIFIMSDDHAYQAISAYGHGLNETPNIDRLAEEGALFTRSTVTNSISAPSRAVLLTGKHSFVNGKVDNNRPFDWDQPNFPKLMQANGYQTAMIGKIHLDGIPQGFDFSMVLPGQGQYYNPDFLINGEKVREEGYCTEIITETTLDWLKNKRDPGKPFCVLYHQKAPHRNWQPAPKYLTLYDDVTFEPPANFFDNYEGRGRAAKEQEMQVHGHAQWGHDFKMIVDPYGDSTGFHRELNRFNGKQRKDWLAAYTPQNEEFKAKYHNLTDKEIALWKYQRYMTDYAKTVKSLDENVGRVLDYLEQNNMLENTIIIYTSDQGFYMGEHGWFDKRFMYEESFSTPLVMRSPSNFKRKGEIREMVQNIDFAPTMLAIAGIEIPSDIQGISLLPLLTNEKSPTDWRKSLYYHYYEYPGEHAVKRHYGVRTDRYKLIHFYNDIDSWELYDLQNDIREMNNLYGNPEYDSIIVDLKSELKKLQEQYDDPVREQYPL